MAGFSSLESLEFLFQKKSSISNQISPHAAFNPASAVGGAQGFIPQIAPDQQPKKRKIYLDYNTIYRLWDPTQIVLTIAKLKEKGFEFAFIQKGEGEKIFASSIEDKAEGDKKYDYKFKDKNGKEIGIFELSDDHIKENFSKLDHEKSIERLGLVRDESIILSFEQFDQIHKVFTQEHWDNKERVSVRSSLSYGFLDGALKKRESYANIVASIHSENIPFMISQCLKDLLTHEDFNIADQETLYALNRLKKLNNDNFFESIFHDIKNEKTLEALFDKISSPSFFKNDADQDNEIIIMQKSILKELWFRCSDFEAVVNRAKTLEEFKDKTTHDIATSIYGDRELSFFSAKNETTHDIATSIYKDLSNHILLTPEPLSFDILERCPEKNVLDIFNFKRAGSILTFSVIAEQRKKETSFGEKIKVDFTLLNNDAQGNFIEFSLELSENKHKESLSLWSFIKIFSNPEINQQFNLTEQFGDKIINLLKEKTLSEICYLTSSSNSNFLEQLNDDQKKQFLDLLHNKVKTENCLDSIKKEDAVSVLLILQYHLDQPEILKFAKSVLTKFSNRNSELDFNFGDQDLTPAFQDLLLEMHEANELDLNRFILHEGSKLFAKFDKSQLELSNNFQITSRDSYLKNIEFCRSKNISLNVTKISSQYSTASPLQITLYDLNIDSINAINQKIASGELDPSKILSVDVLGVMRKYIKEENTLPLDSHIRPCLLMRFIQLFPNLKHARIEAGSLFPMATALGSKHDFRYWLNSFDFNPPTLEDFNTLDLNQIKENRNQEGKSCNLQNKLESLNILADFYDSSALKLKTTEPEHQFSATRTGDTIFMGDARSSGASKQDLPTIFSMEETGKIIQRPDRNQASLYIRETSRKMNLNFVALEDNLFVDIDESQAILFAENASIENSIEKFSQKDFEAKKTELESSDSSDKTICSFSRNLQANAKNILPSISPDNKIIGYYTEPSSANVEFFKDESGFYYAKTATQCQIHYLIEGRELGLQTPTQSLENLPENVKKIITEYVGDDPSNFPFSVKHDDYELPDFTTKKQFLDDLFKLENKGSCRHRVASVAHKFENNGLKCGIDFRIIGVDGKHVLMEVKKNGDEWVTLDLGGSDANMVELSKDQKFQEDSQGGENNYPSFSPKNIEEGLTSILGENFIKFVKGDINYNEFIIAENDRLNEFFNELGNFANDCFPLLSNNPTNSPSCTSTLTVESTLLEIRQLPKIKDLETFKPELKQFITKKDPSSLYLKTSNSEELKNYLLRMSSSSQNPPNPDLTESALTSSSLSFQAFYASSPQDLTAKKSTLHIEKDDKNPNTETKTVNITAETPLLSFLENAKQNNDKQHVLIIDWGNFDASSQVAFNTMFDKGSRKIDDQVIPDNVKIVCIDSSKQQTTDSSILSRFGKALDLSSIKKDQFAKSKNETSSSSGVREIEEIACDGEGLVNWKEKLFGRIIVDGDAIKWEKSEFVKSLEAFGKEGTAGSNPDQPEQKDLHINFKNFSLTQQQEMKIFFEQAKSTGSIDYHDYKITIPQDLSINFAQKEFEFTEVLKSFKPAGSVDSADSSPSTSMDSKQLQLTIYQNSLGSNRLPKDIHLINSHLFDQLLTQPQIDGNQYQEKAGLIESASTSDSKTLKLFLSENLTKQQLYCLLNQAQEHQVALELYVAKGVEIPNANLQKFTQEFELDKGAELIGGGDKAGGVGFSAIRTLRESSPSPESPRIIITNNIEESLKESIKAIESANSQSSCARTINLVNVEDILYGDLFGKTQHQLVTKEDGSQHFAFEKIETALKAKLEAGETVILKGEFSAELLSLLHPQILDLQKKFSNLHFIIEDKNVSKFRPQSSKLSWLDPSLYKVEHSPELAKKTMEEKTAEVKIVREKPVSVGDEIPNESKTQAEDFIKGRKDELLNLLRDNPILQIFGHSGVGKSSLLREIAKTDSTQPSDVAVYNELSSIEAWAQDKSEGKTKILVIDEFNVDGSTNFTLFRDLANNPKKFPQTIFHDGKSVTLTEKHKVVFLGNPQNYGNRFKQKLFEDCQIPEWHLQDFPVSYIYEEILAKPIYVGLPAESKEKLSQEDFKKIAHKEIIEYKAKNQGLQADDGMPKETVRELQEKVLKEIVKKISSIDVSQVQNANFIATEINQQNIAELQSAIEIRKLQKSGKLPPQYLGTCGVIFEGDSGVGKSVMIEAVLENRGITKIDSLENLAQQIKIEKSSEISPAIKPHYYYKIPASLPIKEIEENLIKAFELGVIVVFDEMNTRIEEGGLEKTINQLLTGQHPKNSKIKSQPGFMLIASINKATNAGRSPFSPAIITRSFVIKAESLKEYTQEDFEKIIENWVENDQSHNIKFGKQNDFIQLAINRNSIKETAKQFKKIVSEEDNQANLRDLKSNLMQILEKLNNDNPVEQLFKILRLK